jgi:radical SAM PhpK family P-methyltransferase
MSNEQKSQVDCLVVGYYESDFNDEIKQQYQMKNYNGGYRELELNSVLFNGKRITFMNLFHKVLEEKYNSSVRLHYAEIPNLASVYLKNYIDKHGFSTDMVNFVNYEEDRFKELLDEKPMVVVITTTFYTDNAPIKHIIDIVRKISPLSRIAVGGPHILRLCSYYDDSVLEEIFESMGADYYINESQGESSLVKLLQFIKRLNTDISEVPNVIYFDNNKSLKKGLKLPENNDLNEYAIDWDLFKTDFYVPTIQIRTSRSCAFNCSFCNYPILAGPLALMTVDVVEKELQFLSDKGVKNIIIIDDTFNVPLPRFKEICRMIIKNKFQFQWFSYFRCSNADEEVFDLMAESGCKGVFLGIESGDENILKNMNKFASVDVYKRGISELEKRNIFTYASIIVGFPGETEDSINNTIQFIQETKPTFWRAELYFHNIKTKIQEKSKEYGLVGSGYGWRHNTMDWKKAILLIEDMYRKVEDSVFLPLHGFDFWAIPYLIGKGFSVESIKKFLKVGQGIMLKSLNESEVNARDFMEDLKQAVST